MYNNVNLKILKNGKNKKETNKSTGVQRHHP